MIKFFLFKCCLTAKSSCWNRTELEKIEPMRESPAENQNKNSQLDVKFFPATTSRVEKYWIFFYFSYEILIMTVSVLSNNVI